MCDGIDFFKAATDAVVARGASRAKQSGYFAIRVHKKKEVV